MKNILFAPDKMQLYVASLSQAAAANIRPLEHVQHATGNEVNRTAGHKKIQPR